MASFGGDVKSSVPGDLARLAHALISHHYAGAGGKQKQVQV